MDEHLGGVGENKRGVGAGDIVLSQPQFEPLTAAIGIESCNVNLPSSRYLSTRGQSRPASAASHHPVRHILVHVLIARIAAMYHTGGFARHHGPSHALVRGGPIRCASGRGGGRERIDFSTTSRRYWPRCGSRRGHRLKCRASSRSSGRTELSAVSGATVAHSSRPLPPTPPNARSQLFLAAVGVVGGRDAAGNSRPSFPRRSDRSLPGVYPLAQLLTVPRASLEPSGEWLGDHHRRVTRAAGQRVHLGQRGCGGYRRLRGSIDAPKRCLVR